MKATWTHQRARVGSHSFELQLVECKRGSGMSNYMARVELYAAEENDYSQLDANMGRRGYLRTMTGEDGAIYKLPTGTYYVAESSAMLEVALRAAVDAASETGKEAAVMVTDWRSARWSGLSNAS